VANRDSAQGAGPDRILAKDTLLDLGRLKLQTARRYRKFTRTRKKMLGQLNAWLEPMSNDFDRAPMARAQLEQMVSKTPLYPEVTGDMAVYSTYCGTLKSFTFDLSNTARRFPHYFVSNNPHALDAAEALGWHPIPLDLPVSDNPILSAQQAKIAKAMPHLFPDLNRHRHLAYIDDKKAVPFDDIDRGIAVLQATGAAMATRLSPHVSGNILREFTDAMFQERYRLQAHQITEFMLARIEAGKTLETDRLFTTNFSLRDTAHPRVRALNEAWYDDILACGIECQIAFAFLAQGNADIADLPAPPRKKYLGKKIEDA